MQVSRAINPSHATKSTLVNLPLLFIQNNGQIDKRVAYYVQGDDKALYFTPDGVTIVFSGKPMSGKQSPLQSYIYHTETKFIEQPAKQIWVLKLDFVGSNLNVIPTGKVRANAVVSYFQGSPNKWKTGQPTFAKLVYANLWPGIDLVFSGAANQLKYEFVVQPGIDPHQIRLAWHGATDALVNPEGTFVLSTPLGNIQDDSPQAYQQVDGTSISIAASYIIHKNQTDNSSVVSFDIGNYDVRKILIIDPAIFVYAGFIGGNGRESGNAIAVDEDGNTYITGYTISPEAVLLTNVGPSLSVDSYYKAFVTKVNADGTGIAFMYYIGGNGYTDGTGIAVDQNGNTYVSGSTTSDSDTFPAKIGPNLINSGRGDAFVVKINSTGTDIVYAGFIGGSEYDHATDIAIDSQGYAYITGLTSSKESTFPVKIGPDLTYNGSAIYETDAFVAKVEITGTELDYAGYIGGDDNDQGNDITVDAEGNAYVIGSTRSTEATFPVESGPKLNHNRGQTDAFVTKVSADGRSRAYSGYIGGSSEDMGYGIAVDSIGNAYVTGSTGSEATTFPVTVGPDLTHNGGGYDAFVAKIKPNAEDFYYLGYVGGSNGDDHGTAIAVDSLGNAYIAGSTSSDVTFPVVDGPDLTYNGGFSDAFVAMIKSDGTGLKYAGYIGGFGSNSPWDFANGIAVDSIGNAYVTGSTGANESTFPVRTGPDLIYNGGLEDAFVVKIDANGSIPCSNSEWYGEFFDNRDLDSDGDSLPDIWEQKGVDIDGDCTVDIDLPRMGADANKRDIFVEVDWMEQDGLATHSHEPKPEAIQKIVESFQNAPGGGINLHVDAGPQSTDFVTGKKWGELSRGQSIPEQAVIGTSQDDISFKRQWMSLIDSYFGQDNRVFRYAIFAHQIADANLDLCSSGYGEIQYFIVSLGGWPLCLPGSISVGTINAQAGTLMHELGHTLGLSHGGDQGGEEFNYKPNYLSVMNYHFQTSGLIIDDNDGNFDYSRNDLANLDEESLSEKDGLIDKLDKTYGTKYHANAPYLCLPFNIFLVTVVKDASGPINWDCDLGIDDKPIQQDLNSIATNTTDTQILTGYDDWNNLKFKQGNIGAQGAGQLVSMPIVPITVTQRELSGLESLSIPQISEPRVRVSMSVMPTTIMTTQVITFTTLMSNTDFSDAEDVTLQVNLPNGFNYLSNSTTGITTGNPAISGTVLSWTSLAISIGTTQTVRFQVKATAISGAYYIGMSGTSRNGILVPTQNQITVDIQESSTQPLFIPLITKRP